MSMIPCPGCGLPRAAEQVGTVPCPVCDAGPVPVAAPVPVARRPAAPDPTAGLPADVSQLDRMAAKSSGGSVLFGWAVMFALGVGTGVGGLLAWQAATPDGGPPERDRDTARAGPGDPPPLPPAPGKSTAVAPMPHEPRPKPPESKPAEPPPEPEPPQPGPKPGPPVERAITVELNDPEAAYTVPFPMKKGERVVLKGKVKTLRVPTMDAGSVLDASRLEAAHVFVSGKIDGRSELKLFSPGGTVTFSASVVAKSTVEISAPGGSVVFPTPTGPGRPGSSIDAGSVVTITARSVDLRGDVNGVDTRVTVNLPRSGSLKVAAVRGIATVEYRVADGKGTPDVTVGTVSPTANFRKID